VEGAAVEPLPSPGVGVPLAGTRLLAVVPSLAPLLPEAGLRRGNVLAVTGGGGSTSLLVSLVAGAMAEGSWVGVVGLPALGLEAASRLGLRLDHLALIPSPGAQWTEVVGALVDSVDVVAVVPPGRCRPGDARRLVARTRERGAVMVVVGSRLATAWPEPVDLQLEVDTSSWHGLASGDGTLQRRSVTVRSFGRRAGARERRVRLWLPDPDGGAAPDERETLPQTLGSTREPAVGVGAG
jgi:hypothetical protein